MIDLRSDTCGRPTREMRAAVAEAADVYGDDPTVKALVAATAELLGKEDAAYMPTGTMTNRVGIRAHTAPGDAVLFDQNAHVYILEGGAPAPFSGVLPRLLAGVAAIAAVHASLKQYGDLGTYLHRPCAALRDALGVDGEHRILHLEVEPLTISPAAAQSLGLAVTELVTNALRRAFEPTKSGTVRVNGQYRGDWYQLTVEDNGKGLPHGFDLGVQQSGLGLQMVNMLADTVRARLTAGS